MTNSYNLDEFHFFISLILNSITQVIYAYAMHIMHTRMRSEDNISDHIKIHIWLHMIINIGFIMSICIGLFQNLFE